MGLLLLLSQLVSTAAQVFGGRGALYAGGGPRCRQQHRRADGLGQAAVSPVTGGPAQLPFPSEARSQVFVVKLASAGILKEAPNGERARWRHHGSRILGPKSIPDPGMRTEAATRFGAGDASPETCTEPCRERAREGTAPAP